VSSTEQEDKRLRHMYR